MALQPRYQHIKDYITRHIEDGIWVEHQRVPSENQLCEQFSVSRMTARRALKELTDEDVLERCPGVGTFVAERKPLASLLEVRNIADEVASRGHSYSNRVLILEAGVADDIVAQSLAILPGSAVFHSLMIHCDNEVPLQLEERYVVPRMAPDYLHQDFTSITPNAYLNQAAPLTEADHRVEAILADEQSAGWLDISLPSACLQIKRRTWSRQEVVSYAILTHPGERYRLGEHLTSEVMK